MSALSEGTIFAGRYRVVRSIATGGMGTVYEALHLETERRVALKVMRPDVLQSDSMRERFKREAKVAARIESEFVVGIFDAGVDESTGVPFLVMELLRGEELGQKLKRVGALPAAEAVTYLHQTARALDKMHKASIVHRDLKPGNLFLTEREDGSHTIKVLDFGIAKVVLEGATADATQALGTPLYMAPEQFDTRARVTAAADIYALGMMAYTLLVGSSYWLEEQRAGNIFALTAVAMHGPKDRASARAAAVGVALPPSFDAWFAQATAVDPAQRFSTATQAALALAEALSVEAPGSRASRHSVSDLGHGPSSAPLGAGPASHGHAAAGAPVFAGVAPPGFPPSSPQGPGFGTEPLPRAGFGLGPASSFGSAPAATAASSTSTGTAVTRPMPRERKGAPMLGAGLAIGFVLIAGVAAFALYSMRGEEGAPAQAGAAAPSVAAQAAPSAVDPGSAANAAGSSSAAAAPSSTASANAAEPEAPGNTSASQPAISPTARPPAATTTTARPKKRYSRD